MLLDNSPGFQPWENWIHNKRVLKGRKNASVVPFGTCWSLRSPIPALKRWAIVNPRGMDLTCLPKPTYLPPSL